MSDRRIKRGQTRDPEAELREMFDRAWARLAESAQAEERVERERWFGAYAGPDRP